MVRGLVDAVTRVVVGVVAAAVMAAAAWLAGSWAVRTFIERLAAM